MRDVLALSALLTLAMPAMAQVHADHAARPPVAGKTQAPRQDPEQAFRDLDADKDGYLQRSELPDKHPLLAHFGMSDKNRDGKLDLREFRLALSML
jgi:Ca2+-binding EF-hand superfamily protein